MSLCSGVVLTMSFLFPKVGHVWIPLETKFTSLNIYQHPPRDGV